MSKITVTISEIHSLEEQAQLSIMTKKAVWSSGGSLSSWTLPLQMTLDSVSDTEEADRKSVV